MLHHLRTHVAVVAGIASVMACASTHACSRYHYQAYEMWNLHGAAESFAAEHGLDALTAGPETWFEKLVAAEILYREDWETTPDGTLPLDMHGHPIVLEVVGRSPNEVIVIRLVGLNAADDNGELDDWDSRYGPNLGYWYKHNWPEVYRRAGLCALTALFGTVTIVRTVRRRSLMTGLLLTFLGSIGGVVLPFGFAAGLVRHSASHIPEWVDFSACGGALLLPIGLIILACTALRILVERRAVADHVCATCRYDLRGSPTSVCSECGTDQAEHSV